MTSGSTDVTTPLCPDLRNYLRQFEEAKDEGAKLTEGLSPEQLRWRPEPTKWSIAECLQHLNTTTDAYLPAIDLAIGDARAAGITSPGPYKYGPILAWFTRSMEPPVRRKLKAPSKFLPAADDRPAEDVVMAFALNQDKMIDRIHAAEGLDLGRVWVISPVSRLVRMRVHQCFGFLAAHQRRHLWQAKAVGRRQEAVGSG